MARLEGRNAVVTGAAGGIGAAIAAGLAWEGAAVVVADLDAEAAEAVASGIRARGGQAIAAGLDVRDRAQVRAAIDLAASEYGSVDVVFNNAGVALPKPFLEVTEADWRTVLEVNGLGVLIGIQEAAQRMIAQGTGGKIVNTASVAGRQGYPNLAPYSASKFGVVGLTQAAARALAEHGITVNAFAPGIVGTPMWDEIAAERAAHGAREEQPRILLGRSSTPEDIVPTAIYLASSDSDYTTGQVIPVDGGVVLV